MITFGKRCDWLLVANVCFLRLIDQDRHDEALEVLAAVNAHGDTESPVVALQFREISDTIAYEKSKGLSFVESFMSEGNRKRLIITATFSIIVMLPGTNIITFYFGTMLEQAGIENPTTQLEINIILTSWTLVVSLLGAWFADSIGRKTLCAISLSGQIVTFYILAGLTAVYGTSSDKSGIYGTIALIFLYNAAYAYGITPLTVLYPPEVLSYEVRGEYLILSIYIPKSKISQLTSTFPYCRHRHGFVYARHKTMRAFGHNGLSLCLGRDRMENVHHQCECRYSHARWGALVLG